MYALLFRPTLVLSLEAVQGLQQRLASSEELELQYYELFQTLDELSALCAAHPLESPESSSFANIRTALIRHAHPHALSVVTDFLMAAREPADASAPFVAVFDKYGFPAEAVAYFKTAE